MSENASGDAGNQQGSSAVLARDGHNPSETTRRAPLSERVIRAYLLGALHDGSLNKKKRKRISQKEREWLVLLQTLLATIGYRSWIYREGKTRNVYVLETLADFLDFAHNSFSFSQGEEGRAYVRGFFDAEGGIPKKKEDVFYIQLVQNNRKKLESIKTVLLREGIYTGKIHNPSKRVKPNYWRVYVLARSRMRFAECIGSWHPRKAQTLLERVKI